MRLRHEIIAPLTFVPVIAVAVWVWFHNPPEPDPRPAGQPAAPPRRQPAPVLTIPVPESQAAVDMVRAAEGTVLLSESGQVKTIVLTGSRVADSDLRHLTGTPDLVLLNLDGTQISDEGLAHIRDLPKLKILRLCRTPITDSGLSRLSGLPALESLHIDETRISDEGLRGLGEFRSLNSINALGCPLSSEAETIVRERMPGCRVKH
jgi:hypothetical protein